MRHPGDVSRLSCFVAALVGVGVIAAIRAPHSDGSMSIAPPARRRCGDTTDELTRSSSRKRDAML